KVHIGTREPVITVTTTNDTSTDNIQYVDVGVKVDVEPNIQLDNTVETKLTLEVSQVIDSFTTNNGSVALTISTTNAQSVLTLKDGVQTILGGLFEKQSTSSVNTIPILGDLPLIGKLFSGFNDRGTKREILLSITPYIVKQVEVPTLDVATIWSGGEDNLKDGPNFGAFARPVQSEVQSTRPSPAPALIKPEPQASPVGESPASPEVPAERPGLPEGQVAPPTVEPTPVPGEGEIPQPPLPAEAIVEPVVPTVLDQATEPVVEEVAPVEEPIDPAVLATPQSLELPSKGPARLSLAGPPAVSVGDEVSLAVEVRHVEALYSAPLFVSYDPEMLELILVNEGSFLKQGGQSTVFSSSPNRTTGQVIVGYKQGAGGSGSSGSGLLFTLAFRARAAGTTEISLNRINFRDPNGTRLAVEPAAMAVEIR
ncbi:MAG: cohesin domain-containing protein, partial [Desulfuromonadales bacterium]|nr:cohesin domain-containing protein [Desulfuromonadales bacterium]